MKYFIAPADFKKETIDGYDRLNHMYEDSKVIETYGNITIGNTLENGRYYKHTPKIDIKGLEDYVKYSSSKGIEFNYTLNGSCMGNREFTKNGIADMKDFLNRLYEGGIHRLTVTLPSVYELVRSTGLDFEIKASTICQITNANKALDYKRAGFDRIVADESLNRDFEALKRTREAFGENTEIIVNSLCHKDCVNRMFHYNQTAHESVSKENSSILTYYIRRCILKTAETPANLMRLCWVRPEDLKYYVAIGVTRYKIQGRNKVMKGDPVRVVEAYFEQSYDGDLINLMELFSPPSTFNIKVDNKKLDGYIKPFFDDPDFCRRDCENCGYCEKYIKKCTDYQKAVEINDMAFKFYNERDEYTNALNSLITTDREG